MAEAHRLDEVQRHDNRRPSTSTQYASCKLCRCRRQTSRFRCASWLAGELYGGGARIWADFLAQMNTGPL